jgi:hypothetical protein
MGSEVKWLARAQWLKGVVEGSPSPGIASVREDKSHELRSVPTNRLEVIAPAERAPSEQVDWTAPLDPSVAEAAKNLPATGSLSVGTVTQTERRLRPSSERTVGAEDPAAWAVHPTEVIAGDRGGYRWVERDTDKDAGRTLGSEQQQVVVVKILDELADGFPIVKNTAIYSETDPENFGQAEGTYIYSGEPSTARLIINFAATDATLRKQGIIVDEIPEDRLYTAVSTTYDDALRAMVVHETAHSLEKSLLHLASKKGRRRTKEEQAFFDAKAAFDAWVAARVTEPLRAHGHDRSWYATENAHEWIAEAFADGYLNRDNPSPEGKIVYDFYASIFGSDPPRPQEFRP